MVAGLAMIVLLALLVLVVGKAGLRAAERERLSDRSRLVERIAQNASNIYDPGQLRTAVERLSFRPGQPDSNALLLRQFQLTPAGDPSLLVALVDPAGTPGAAFPAGHRLSISDLGVAWSAALAGRAAVSPVFVLDDRIVRATVVPVGAGPPWAILVQVADEAVTQRRNEQLVAFAGAPGGFSDLDAMGVTLSSSDQASRGRRLLAPAELTGLVPGTVRVWTSGRGAAQVTTFAARQRTTGYTTIFRQPTARLFADPRAEQRRYDLLLFVICAVCLGGLVAFRLRRERAAKRGRARAHTVLGGIRDIIVVAGENRAMTFVSPAVWDLLGYDPAYWLGYPLTDFAHADDVERIERLLAEPGGGTAFDVRLTMASGATRWFDLETSDLTDHPALAGVLVTCHETGERKSLQDQLSHQASHDALTGIPNRTLFTSELAAAAGAARSGGAPFALLFIDLDHFKPVNDSLGHDAGDVVLRIVAERLVRMLRDGDVAARLGGDEFGILLAGADEASAGAVADRVIKSIRAPIAVGTSVVQVDVSIGVAASTLPLEAPEHFLSVADQAMYEAKRSGKGRFVVAAAARPSAPAGTPGVVGRSQIPVIDLSSEPHPTVPHQPTAGTADRPRRASGRPAPTGRAGRHGFDRLLTPLVSGGVLLMLVTVILWLETQARYGAEHRRMAERTGLTTIMADFSARIADPQRLIGPASQVPWSLTDQARDTQLLRSFAASGFGGKNYVWALASPSGGTLAALQPSATPLPIGPLDEAWRTALGGRAGNSPVMTVDGVPRDYVTIPVIRAGQPVAVLVMGESLRDSPTQASLAAGGMLGPGLGGFSIVDSAGAVMFSWNPALIGHQLAFQHDLAGLRGGAARQIHPAGADGQVTLAAVIGSLADGGYVIFQQPVSGFYGDIRSGRLRGDVSLLACIATVVIGFTVLSGRREAALRREEGRLQALLHNAHDLVLTSGEDGRITFVSSAVEVLLGYRTPCYAGRQLLSVAHPEDLVTLAEFWRLAREVGTAAVRDVRLRAFDGGYRWFDIEASDLRDQPEAAGIVLTCHEIGERRALQDQLRHQGRHDALTGLPNRAAFVRRLHGIAADGAVSTFAVLFIDLDRFKPLNDTYGHDVGDKVLRIIGARLGRARGEEDVVYRLGGDEFAVVLCDADDTQAHAVADRLLDTIRRPMSVGVAVVSVDATIGIAVAESADSLPEVVVHNADLAMYRAKKAGRNRNAVLMPTPSEASGSGPVGTSSATCV
ncbi:MULTISPECIES: diguanylate cyclase domain-containing protein [unclassified Frankia]|uniref:diguanylate cyclase domain-containing protein n=2 Tax=Frankia TaxID=1854 RepID=UPI001EF5914A|nr:MULTISPECIES: diguanylate cyclase [unclassified Frankia]